jgi:V/A-type H+/Na+-transporting ATPase subunit C
MPGKIFGTVVSHGLKGRMLTKNELQMLAESRDMDELVTRMKNTVYLDALAKLTKPYTADKIENALREYLVNTHAKLVNISGGARILSAYFVKHITWNLKMILKGKALGKSYDDLLPKINLRAEELVGRRDLVVKALVSKNLDEAVSTLSGSEFADDVTKAAAIYKDKGDVRIFDVYLDHVFYHDLGRALNTESQSMEAKNIVSVDIDSYNVLSILRGKFWNLSPDDINNLMVASTSKVTKETLQKMINAEKISEAIAELSNTVYKDIVPQNPTSDIDSVLQIEKGFENIGLKRAISAFRTMFSVGNALAALKLIMVEVRNLSAIASGIEQKIPAETIVSKLINLN